MDLRDSPSNAKFRKDLRAWLAQAVPEHGASPPATEWEARRDYDARWQRKLYDAGFAGINWPAEYGGRDATLDEQLIFYEEYGRADAPYVGVNFVGLLHGGPTLIAEGTPEQKERHVRRILRGEEVWCQGFSEPSAGSDLASLRTRAVRDGDHYVVSGQKIWTSHAQVADYAEMLVRTDPDAPKHAGITWLIMAMDSEGVEVRPLRTLHGESEFSELFLNNVRIPVENRVGDENDGWRVSNVTLRFERGTAFAADMIHLQRYTRELARLAKRTLRNGASAWEDRALRRDVGHLRAEIDALWMMVKHSVSEANRTGVPGVGASAVKLFYTDVYERATQLGLRLLGRGALEKDGAAGLPSLNWVYRYKQAISVSIAGGSSQIQRNIIGERILGQPKDR